MRDNMKDQLLLLGQQLTALQYTCQKIREQIFVAVNDLPQPTMTNPPDYMAGRWVRRPGDGFNVTTKKESTK